MDELQNSDEISEEETSPQEESSASEERTIPYSRFKEVNDRKRELEEKISSQTTSEQPQADPNDKEARAREYLSGLVKEQLEATKKAEIEAQKAEQQAFEREVDDILELNSGVQKDDFLKFIEEEAGNYGIESVDGAMRLYKRFNAVSEEAKESAKKDVLSKPSLPKSEGASSGPKPDDSGKSLSQIAEEIKRELK